MQFNLEVRLFNSETKEFHCFKHAVQSVMLEQSDFYMEVDDFTNHMTSPACVKCHPDFYEHNYGEGENNEDQEVVEPVNYLSLFIGKPTEEDIVKDELQTKGFAIKSKIKKGR